MIFNQPKWIIFDLDGTVADSRHRSHHIRSGTGDLTDVDWDAWDAGTPDDTPILETLHVLKGLRATLEDGVRIMFLTARGERARELTVAWLIKHRALEADDLLIMRGVDDTRPDTVIKREVIERHRALGHEFLYAFEDRRLVANMMRELGIFVFHVADYD